MSILEKLSQNKTPILLAEIGAYLHDLGKARKEFILHYSLNGGNTWDGHNYSSIFEEDLKNLLSSIEIEICQKKVILLDFIEKHHKERENAQALKDCEIPELIRLLYARWNGYDGMDSGLDKGANVKQKRDKAFIATAFGHEYKKIDYVEIKNYAEKLYEFLKNKLSKHHENGNVETLRKEIFKETKVYFSKFLGETRRSANDVTLWDHSYSVATLYKCAIVKNIIDSDKASFDPLDFDWQILCVGVDVLSLLSKGIKIGDIKGYEKFLDEFFGGVKDLIEIKAPLGNEIYRDTTGIYFLIPDLNNDLENEIKKAIKEIKPELIQELGQEILVKIVSFNEGNNGAQIANVYKVDCSQPEIDQDKNKLRSSIENKKKEKLKKILPHARNEILGRISFPFSSENFSVEKFNSEWKKSEGLEVCPVCRLLPVKEGGNLCETCSKRREKQSKDWIENPQKRTIWLDEVADHNDRVALLCGSFILDKWLDGTFIKTMAIRVNSNQRPVSKNPSPARIRRVWNTTQEFINETILGKYEWNSDPRRKRIKFKIAPNLNIPEGATCDINLGFSPVCIDRYQSLFLSTVNLEILEKFGKTAEEIAKNLNGLDIKFKTEDDKKWKEGKILNVVLAAESYQDYLPYIKIYDSPDQFIILVPAYDAFEITKQIFEEYEVQFSKVRDRLPFHLGIIAFHKRTPLYIAMEAGKKLLKAFKQKTQTLAAQIEQIEDYSDNKFGKYAKKLTIRVDSNYASKPLTWYLSYSTGDPEQEDEWHPYIRIAGSNPSREPPSFDYTGNGNYVVHVKELKANDKVLIEPAYFKMIFLESSTDRFRTDEDLRPIDDIREIDELWREIKELMKKKNLGIAQLYAYWQEVEKRKKDYENASIKENFIKDSLINIFKLSPAKEKDLFNKLFQATMDGLLDLCLYWNLQVRKEKP